MSVYRWPLVTPPTPIYPGVYVEEEPTGAQAIIGVTTSVTAFVGSTPNGPANDPIHLFSLGEFEGTFGGGDPEGELSTAVRLFFMNGGSEAIIVRVAPDGNQSTAAAVIGTEASASGLVALGGVDLFNILIAPGEPDPCVHAAMITCAERRRAFAILDLPIEVETGREG